MVSSVLIANRGEIACRVIHACHELGLRAVAVYSAADRTAKHVQLADAAVYIGDAPPSASYLNIAALLDAARQTGCDAVHPGYGFLSEREAFAQAVLDAGLVWVGPPPQAIAQMGVKTTARALMQAAGVPVVPGYQSDEDDLPALIDAAQSVGFPLMVKAAGGGGGKGIRIVRAPHDLTEALTAARSEALKAFNDPRLFLERYIEHGRHIEVQLLGDQHGTLLHLYERDCSTQRRHQKIIEESPSPFLSVEQRAAIGEVAVRAGRAVNYVNAGTVEMIATPQGELFFLEMNTRLQVEHPVTEFVTGLDLVKWQLRIAAGERLPFTQAQISQRGHAIECRLYAEDPQNGFLPAVGRVEQFIPPQMPGVRVDSGVQSGDEITIHYDPMIAKIIAHDETRAAAIARMIAALRQTVVLGTVTNREFLLQLLEHPDFRAAQIDTTTLDERLAEFLPPEPQPSPLAFIAAALAMQSPAQAAPAPEAAPDPWARRDGWRLA
ncbi:biotin carboxylase N-terminal domain-containing protein [Aggregatilineales bacterium SYSU G02658]